MLISEAMDINWYGQSCFRIKGKSVTVVTDPYDPVQTHLRLPKDLSADIVLISHSHPDHNFPQAVINNPLVINGPGEYEKLGVMINGVPTYHDNTEGSERGKNTAYHLLIDGVNIVHLGDLGHLLSEEQLSEFSQTDILMIPVGGVYTIDAEVAAKVVAQLEPKIVIPMHYKLAELKYELEDVDKFLKTMGAESVEPQPKFSISKEKLPEETTVVVLSKS